MVCKSVRSQTNTNAYSSFLRLYAVVYIFGLLLLLLMLFNVSVSRDVCQKQNETRTYFKGKHVARNIYNNKWDRTIRSKISLI